jgi:hypothetical protein
MLGRLRPRRHRAAARPGYLALVENEPAREVERRRELVAPRLIAATDQVGRVSGRHPAREFLRWVSRGRLGRSGWPVSPRLRTPWQDTESSERFGWRERAANDLWGPDDEFAFAVDYRICRRCELGWVEQPYTRPDLQRAGLASAGLAALRREYPQLAWHTLGGHLSNSWSFWRAVGAGVRGGYEPRALCEHMPSS